MDRGLVVGGALICASFLVAVALNQSDHEEPENVPKEVTELPAPEPSVPSDLVKCLEPDEEAVTQKSEQAVPECE